MCIADGPNWLILTSSRIQTFNPTLKSAMLEMLFQEGYMKMKECVTISSLMKLPSIYKQRDLYSAAQDIWSDVESYMTYINSVQSLLGLSRR